MISYHHIFVLVRVNMVHVTHIKSPASFMVQKQSDSNKMQVLTNAVNKWGESEESKKAIPDSVDIGLCFLSLNFSVTSNCY